MPIRSSSPKAVRNAMKALVAAVLAAGATAVPATAYQLDGASDAAQRTATAFAPGLSDAAQRRSTATVAFSPGRSDAAQRRSTATVAFSPGRSDAAQRRSTATVAFSPGRSDAAQRSADETAPVVVPPVTRTVAVADEGFDWSSAAIGAGGAAGLLVVCAGGALAITPKRRAVGHA